MEVTIKTDISGTFIGTLIGVVLTAAAWLWPQAPAQIRFGVCITFILTLMFSQTAKNQGFQAWITSLRKLLILNYPMAISALLSGAAIFGISTFPESNLLIAARFVLTGLLAASLVLLRLGKDRDASIRVVKGSGDKIYFVEDRIKRHIPNPLTLAFVLLEARSNVERISDTELRLLREETPLPDIASCETVKGEGPSIYVIWEGKRKHIPDQLTLDYFFVDRQAKVLSDAELEEIPRSGGLPSIVTLPFWQLEKSSPLIKLIESQVKR